MYNKCLMISRLTWSFKFWMYSVAGFIKRHGPRSRSGTTNVCGDRALVDRGCVQEDKVGRRQVWWDGVGDEMGDEIGDAVEDAVEGGVEKTPGV